MPVALRLLEAFVRLEARLAGKMTGSFMMAMIGYMGMYVDDDGLLRKDLLAPPCNELYRRLNEEDEPTREWLRALVSAFSETWDLPDDESD